MRIYETHLNDCCILRVAAGTNGLHGGDSGHGCRTVLELQDLAGTDIAITPMIGGVRLELGGDAELRVLIEALRFATQTLEHQIVEFEKVRR